MTARCGLTELPVDMCAHCLGHTSDDAPPRPKATVPLGPAIEARYPGLCAACGHYYHPGTTIRRSPDGWTADCCTEET